MALATLSVDLVARLGNLETAFERSAQVSKKHADAIAKAYNGATATIKDLGAALAGAFAVGQLTQAIRATVDGMDALNDAADATGISIERLSGLENFIAGFGGQLSDVTGLVLTMNRALSRADDDETKGVSKALSAIGIEADKLRELKPDEALLEIARALDKFEDSGAKTRVIQTIFKDAQSAAPVLKDLAGAGQLNATVTAQQAEQAERFNKHLAVFQQSVVGASRDLVTALLPALDEFARKSEAARVANVSLAEQIRAGFSADKSIGEMKDRIAEIDAELAKLDKRRRAPGSIFKGGLFGLANDIDESKLTNERIALVERLNAARTRAAQGGASAPAAPEVKAQISFDGALGAGSRGPKGPTESQLIAARQRAQEFFDQYSPLALRAEIGVDWEQFASDVDKRAKEGADQVAAILAQMDLQAAGQTPEQLESAERMGKLLADQVERYRDIADPSRKYREQLEEIARLGRTLDEQGNPLLSPDEVEKSTAAINDQIKSLEKTKSAAEELGLTFSSAFEDAIVKGAGFRDVLSGISQDIARIVIRRSVTEPLADAVTNFTKGINWGDFFKFADGGIMTSAGPVPLRKYSGGGIANSPQAAIFAEGGVPEAFVPVPSGKIPVEMRGSAGNVTIVQHISVDARSDIASVRAAMSRARDEAVAAVRGELQRGGPMARLVGKS